MLKFEIIIQQVQRNLLNKKGNRAFVMPKKQKNNKNSKQNAGDLFGLAMWIFAAFGLEIVLIFIETKIYAVSSLNWTIRQNCLHWALISLFWAIISFLIVRSAKKDYDFDILKRQQNSTLTQILFSVLLVIVGILFVSYMSGGFKPVLEYKKLGSVQFIFQYITYFFKSILVILAIALGQKAGDLYFQKDQIPWGGYFLAVSWGFIQFVIQNPATGLFTVALSVLFGVLFMINHKNTRIVFPMIAIVLML